MAYRRQQEVEFNARSGQRRALLPLALEKELNGVQRGLDLGGDIQAFAFPPPPGRIVVLLVRDGARHMEGTGHCSSQGRAVSQKSSSCSKISSGSSSSGGMPPVSPSSSNE